MFIILIKWRRRSGPRILCVGVSTLLLRGFRAIRLRLLLKLLGPLEPLPPPSVTTVSPYPPQPRQAIGAISSDSAKERRVTVRIGGVMVGSSRSRPGS